MLFRIYEYKCYNEICHTWKTNVNVDVIDYY